MELTEGAPSLPKLNISSTVWKGQWMGALGLACILAFSWIPNSYYMMVGWPWILLWQAAFLLLGAWNIWAIRQFSVPYRLLGYGLDWVIGAAVAASVISALAAEFKAVALWNGLLFGNYVIALYLLVNWLRQGLSRKALWFSLSLAGVVTSLISLSFWRPTPDMWLSDDFYAALRNSQPLGHHNFVGGYELLLLPITASLCLSQRGWKRGVGVGATLVVAAALYISGSRGAMVGALAVVLVGGPIFAWLHRAQANRRWLMGGAVALAVVVAIAASNPRMRGLFTLSASSQLSQSSSDTSAVVIADGPARDRLFMLQAGQNIFSTHPLTGVGPGNLSRVYNLYRPVEVGNGLELVQQLHNTPAQILAEVGILGLIAYGSWLVGLLALGIRLHGRLSQSADRYLLYGIFASYLGYGVSSLTDYQLENIGISSTLLIAAALLINLGDTYIDGIDGSALSKPATLSRQGRRWLSLGVLAFLCVSFQLWIRADAGLYLSDAAFKDIEARDLVEADAKWLKAGALSNWDPTYPALAAEQLIALEPGAASQSDQKALTQTAIEYIESALEAAPNDTWFNQNLAVLYLESNQPEKAEFYAQRTVQLSPRNLNYAYYTLASAYLQQDKIEQAVTALSLEAIANPAFLTTHIWKEEPFAQLLPSVLEKTLKRDRQILSQANPASAEYAWLNEQLAMVSWWHQRSLDGVDRSKLRPLAQAILEAEEQPKKALNTVEQQLKLDENDPTLRLLQVWLAPDQYLDSYLQDFEGTLQEKDLLIKHIRQNRDIRIWLNSVLSPSAPRLRFGLGFAYRNLSANNVKQILYPGRLNMSFFAELLGLFEESPIVFPQLDQTISAVKTEELSLPPLSETRFQFPKS